MLLLGKPRFIEDYYAIGSTNRKLLEKLDIYPIFFDGHTYYFGKQECREIISKLDFVKKTYVSFLLKVR